MSFVTVKLKGGMGNQMFQIAIWAQRNGFFINPSFGAAAVPTYLIAILAGLLSFFSPCVLPLVPAYMGYLSSHAVRISPTVSARFNPNP